MTSPLISFVIPARNDQYSGNANYRLQATLDFLAMGLHKLGRTSDAEIIVVDWGSDVALSASLNLSAFAREISRFVVVSREIAQKACPQHSFPTPIVLNTGIRRAAGTFIAQALADILFPEKALKILFSICDNNDNNKLHLKTSVKKTLFIFNRKQIPIEIVNSNHDLTDLDRFIQINDKEIQIDSYPFYMVPADCQVMHRDLWSESHGYDERHVYWGWTDVDMILRMRLRYCAINKINNENLYVYHLNHYVTPQQSRKENPFFFNPFTINDSAWGLADYDLNEVSSTSSPNYLSKDGHVERKNEKYYREKYMLYVLKFAVTNLSRKNIKLTGIVLKAILADSPKNSIWHKMYFYFRKLRRKNRNWKNVSLS